VETLDNILSGKGEAVPEPEKQEPVKQEAERQEEPAASTDVAEQQPEAERGKVPIEALHAERQKVKRYTEQVADFERKLKESDSAWERRLNQMVEALKPNTPKEQPTDWFQDPDVAFRQRGEELISPVISHMQAIQSELAQMKAERVFGDKYQDFIAHVTEGTKNGDPEIRALAAMMDASPRPYEVAKDWFEKRTFDPAQERERLKAELLAEMQGGQVQKTVMPTPLEAARNVGSRRGPAWAGPTPLSDIFKR